MVNGRMFFYRIMRDFFEFVWVSPGPWLYWDEKILAERAKNK